VRSSTRVLALLLSGSPYLLKFSYVHVCSPIHATHRTGGRR
jgi:hypothetical protein